MLTVKLQEPNSTPWLGIVILPSPAVGIMSPDEAQCLANVENSVAWSWLRRYEADRASITQTVRPKKDDEAHCSRGDAYGEKGEYDKASLNSLRPFDSIRGMAGRIIAGAFSMRKWVITSRRKGTSIRRRTRIQAAVGGSRCQRNGNLRTACVHNEGQQIPLTALFHHPPYAPRARPLRAKSSVRNCGT